MADGPTIEGDKNALSGRPVQIIKINDDDHTFELDEEALSKILNNSKIRDRPICVVSVAGAFRRGKSFLLDFMLRYLSRNCSEKWLGEGELDDAPLEGFHWRGGADRDTTGILVWSQVFEMKKENGQQVAVLLMDTQGAFDSSSTVKDCATIFALSAMISSVLVYNLTSNIQEDDLQHLQLFTEYGRLAIEDSGVTPFQKLQFLVRDWSFPYETAYGEEGGRSIVDKRLTVNEKQHPELQSLRKHINSCFDQIEGFLLPHPGLKVSTDPNFKGGLQDIEPSFKEYLKKFMPLVLSPENIVVKKISGNEVKSKDLLEYFRAYVAVFQGDEMPQPKSMLEATSEANNLASLSEAKDSYVQGMESVCGGDKPYINDHLLEAEHLRVRDNALEIFSSKRKMGGEEFSQKYKEQLEHEIDESFGHYRMHNEGKNIFKAANTPITFFCVAMICYMLSQILGLIGLYPFSNLFNLVMIASFLIMAVWAYVKYTGNVSELGSKIDALALTIWESGLQPAINKIAEEGTQYAARQAVQRLNSTTTPPSALKKKQR